MALRNSIYDMEFKTDMANIDNIHTHVNMEMIKFNYSVVM